MGGNLVINTNQNISEIYSGKNERIADGNFGAIRKVTNAHTGRDRVVKVLRKKKLSVELLVDEINIMMRMDHRNIVKFFGVYEDHVNFYTVWEYCSGGALFDNVALLKDTDGGLFTEPTAAHIMTQILKAVRY